MGNRELVWVVHTTRYREGGAEIGRAARTLARARAAAHPELEVRCQATETKGEFVAAIEEMRREGRHLRELHFVGHGGMYGPMFGTRARPEQLSPHEWGALVIPWAEGATAHFHACRSGRFFAPFFARTQGVPAEGYHWYTTFSRAPDRFVWDGPRSDADAPLYVFGCPGRRSHGVLGSLRKYVGLARAEKMRRFEPEAAGPEAGYDEVAGLYDEAFADIRLRDPEWRWIEAHLPAGRPRVLDLGCGNGALLAALSTRISEGLGVDASAEMLARAERRAAGHPHLAFRKVDGPLLPAPDRAFDVVISLMSFRYLDWDPILEEVRRVLAPGGRLLVVDMAERPAAVREWPRLAWHKARLLRARRKRPAAHRALSRMVRDPRWAAMLEHNPMRAEHEYVWYLESRFPGRRVERLDIGLRARTLAFDSGPLP